MFGYLLYVKPFDGRFSNRINIYCEFVVIVTFVLILFMNLFTFSELITRILGWILICMIAIVLICLWISVIPGTLKSLYNAFITKPKKDIKKQEQKKEERRKATNKEYRVET